MRFMGLSLKQCTPFRQDISCPGTAEMYSGPEAAFGKVVIQNDFTKWKGLSETAEIGRASCRERVLRLV